MTDDTATRLDDDDRRRVRISVWLMVAAAVVALLGIFGFGGLTGAGDYFSDDPALHDAAVRDHYWQIWGILLPIAAAILASGVSVFILSGVLTRMGRGWTAHVTRVVRWIILPLSVLGSLSYLAGPDGDAPAWLAAVAGFAGMASYAAILALGVAIFGLPLPSWTGIALIVGTVLASVTFLPLFVFVGTLVGGIGMLRWNTSAAAPAEIAADARP